MEDINLVEIINLFLRKWWLIVVLMLVGGTAAYMYTDLFVDPTYMVEGSFYVNCVTDQNEVNGVTSQGQLNSNSRLALSCAEIFKTRNFLEQVSERVNNELGTNYSWGNIKGMLNVSPLNETEILKLILSGSDKDSLPIILNYIMDYAPGTVMQIINGGSLEAVDRPADSAARTGPNVTKNTIIGIVGGLIVSVLIIFLVELFDTHIKTVDDVKNKYKEPVLGEIPSLYSVSR